MFTTYNNESDENATFTFRNKKEFIYYLGGKYYVIGSDECKECEDNQMIVLFNEFEDLTDNDEFKNYDVREMEVNHRNKVAKVFIKLSERCYVPVGKNNLTDDKFDLRERLEKKYSNDIILQFERWKKADTCKFRYEIDKQKGDKA